MSDKMYNVNDIIEINNNEKYVVVNKLTYQEEDYYYIVLIDDINKVLKDVCKIVKLKKDNDIVTIELVEDRQELEAIIPLFKKQYA
ncbi:MAG: hypothetical protein ACI4VR_03610 [Bacilli bacterium]|jgi:hypothetical protein